MKLKVNPDFDFQVVGIVTPEPIYSLAWQINEALKISLVSRTEIRLYHQKRQLFQSFEYFNYSDINGIAYELISNKGAQGTLIEEQPQIDFLLKISDENICISEILEVIKGLKNISLTFEIKPGLLKSKKRLLFSPEDE